MDRKQALNASSNANPPSSNVSVDSHNGDEQPPAYTANSALHSGSTSGQAPTQFTIRPFPTLDYAAYRPASSTISSDHTTITTSERILCKSPSALAEFIRLQAALPPRPYIRISGNSNDGFNTGFNIRINLQPYLYRSTDPWNYLSLAVDPASSTEAESSTSPQRRLSSRYGGSQNMSRSLEAWTKEFISDPASIKTFVLERQIVNFDIDTLSGLIRNTFADIKYRGHLEVKLESTFTKVVVDYQPSKGASAFFRPLVSAFVGSRDYQVAKAVWPFAKTGPEEERSGEREFASVSEAAWWKEWKVAVAKAAIEKRKGWVTVDDKIEAVMTGWVQDALVTPWGSSHGAGY